MGTPGMQRMRTERGVPSLTEPSGARPKWLDNPTEAKRSGVLPLKPPTASGRPYDAGTKR